MDWLKLLMTMKNIAESAINGIEKTFHTVFHIGHTSFNLNADLQFSDTKLSNSVNHTDYLSIYETIISDVISLESNMTLETDYSFPVAGRYINFKLILKRI